MYKPVTYRHAADLLTRWADRRLGAKPAPGRIDFQLEDDCDFLCRWLADDPERALDTVPAPLLRHLRIRVMFAVGAALTQGDGIIGEVPSPTPDAQILAGLLGVQLADTRLPPEWRLQ